VFKISDLITYTAVLSLCDEQKYHTILAIKMPEKIQCFLVHFQE